LARGDVADYVAALFLVYTILILLSVLISMIPRIPFYSRWFRAVLDFITETTDPYLNLFRRVLPRFGGGSGFAIDVSPILGILVLVVVGSLVTRLIEG
jgi:YggT family protein